MPPVTGILLAAGRSRRFGTDKLRAVLPDGTPLGLRAAQALIDALPNMLAVVAPADRETSVLFAVAGIRTIPCSLAAQGMGHSIACGVAATAVDGAWVIALADMPYIKVSTIRRVAEAVAGGASIAAPYFEGRRGHPVGFGKDHRSALLALHGDRGARDLLAAADGSIERIDVEDPGILRDIDLPADLAGAGVR